MNLIVDGNLHGGTWDIFAIRPREKQPVLLAGSGVAMVLQIDIISDVICPWCWIGKRRLEKAIAALDRQVKVRWLPFQLNPTMPKDGIVRRDYRIRKFGSWEWSLELDAQVAAAGKAEDIHFAFDRMERTPNTVDAHRLIWLADQQGVQDAVVEALFRAYFTQGQDISKRQTLLDVVAEAGLDRERAESVVDIDEGQEALREADELGRRFRLDGVPFFIVNSKITLAGAQQPDACEAVLRVRRRQSLKSWAGSPLR